MLPPLINMEPGCPAVYDQTTLGSCTANGIAGGLEYDQIKQGIVPSWTPSRLFIYWNERNEEGTVDQDAGADIRDGIKAVNSLGAPPETEWPYDVNQFAVKPPPQVFADALQHPAVKYQAVSQDINQLRAALAAGFPVVFGFSVYESFESDAVAESGILPMPAPGESQVGGHCVLCVGYDDSKQMVKVRNSWGADWGQGGYFWMPYAYISNPDLADDFWQIEQVK